MGSTTAALDAPSAPPTVAGLQAAGRTPSASPPGAFVCPGNPDGRLPPVALDAPRVLEQVAGSSAGQQPDTKGATKMDHVTSVYQRIIEKAQRREDGWFIEPMCGLVERNAEPAKVTV